MDTAASWRRLTTALMQYELAGYKYVGVPWMVPYEFQMATCPDERFLVSSEVGFHVGSAEQGFIYRDAMGELGKGKFVALTPCFRNEDVIDAQHQHGFMKVELYQNTKISEATLEAMINKSEAIFRNFLYHCEVEGDLNDVISRVKTQDGYDIEIAGVEVGSYGIREWRGLEWMYGTGLAEPRFSVAVQHIEAMRRGVA